MTNAICWLISVILLIPSSLYACEIFASFMPRKGDRPRLSIRPKVAVIVPAHNEEAGIGNAVLGILAQLQHDDRLIVVADNCTDDTASIAAAQGAEVVVRSEPSLRGKGFALDAGRRHIAVNPPPIIIFIDADCFLGEYAIAHLVNAVKVSGRAAQGVNLMLAPKDSDLRTKVAEFAFLVKNRVRPTGLHRLGLGCQLTGSGMAFAWHLIAEADIANGNLVEDMKLGLDLTVGGLPPILCEDALIYSYFPHSQGGVITQRRRWERGHLSLIRTALRQLINPAVMFRPKAALLALDLTVPPLSLLLLTLVGSSVLVTVLTSLFELGWAPAALSVFAVAMFLSATVMAWIGYGRKVLPPRAAIQVLPYILAKMPLYFSAARGVKEYSWIRTDRKKDAR